MAPENMNSDKMFLELSTQWVDLKSEQRPLYQGDMMKVIKDLKRKAVTEIDVFVARALMASAAKIIEGAGQIRAERAEAN